MEPIEELEENMRSALYVDQKEKVKVTRKVKRLWDAWGLRDMSSEEGRKGNAMIVVRSKKAW